MKSLPTIRRLLKRPRRPLPGRLRRGSVLIVVLVVILLLTYGVYGFTERMLAETEATTAYGRAAQATAFAQSGVEFAASAVTARAADPENPISLYHVPETFSVIMHQSPTVTSVGRFSLVAPVESDPSARQLRFGLQDESGKLNLNAIKSLSLEEIDEHYLLMGLPGMTDDIADAILDYIDDDEVIRPLGAESEYYEALTPPYFSKNGPLESIDELLLVRGVTPQLLYGEDANRNGLLDPNEDDGAGSPPLDDADGLLLPGWHSYLTIYSRETNLRADGSKKININQGLLTDLYDAIMEEMDDEEAAKFIVAYRMYGPNDGEYESDTGTSGKENSSSGDDSGGEQTPDGSSSERSGAPASGSGGPTQSEADALDATAKAVSNALTGAQAGGTVTRGGLDLSKGAQYEVRSLYDLIDREVDIPADTEKNIEAETLTSSWTTGSLLTDYPVLLDMFALSDKESFQGRVNVNEARVEVLYGLPGMPPELADTIVAARSGTSGQPLSEEPERRTTAWLVAQGIADLRTMRAVDKYLTARGDVFKVQSVGFFDGGGPTARIEAVIDGSVTPAKIVSFRDLSDLGRGYAPSQLLPAGGQTSP